VLVSLFVCVCMATGAANSANWFGTDSAAAVEPEALSSFLNLEKREPGGVASATALLSLLLVLVLVSLFVCLCIATGAANSANSDSSG